MATNSAAGNGAIQSPAFAPTANPTFASRGQTPSSSSITTNTNQGGVPLSSEAKAQILGTSDASTAGRSDAKEAGGGGGGGKGASEHAPGSSAQEQGVAAEEEGWNEEVKNLERRMGNGQGGSGLGR
ncbi:hypothetical protein QR685DRAFT_21097 [Neurospora intermedia]|uniref:SMP domain-containing protein n=1 Tax=Neurospora intermedia TaxID=5142 RepID=A0ABR3DPZ1_NEUIN